MSLSNRHRNNVADLILTAIGVLLAFIPTYIFIGVYILLAPVGFWQILALIAISLITLGTFQLMLLYALVVWIFAVWLD